jgi:hypothetical protein
MSTFGAETAFKTFKERYLKNKDKERVNNSNLYAGSPMYYYCKGCFALIAKLPETHLEPAPQYCLPCQIIVDHGLMHDFQKRANQS